MNLFLTQEERLAAVLDNVLSPDILTDDDMDLLFSRLCEAIQQKSKQGFSCSSVQRH